MPRRRIHLLLAAILIGILLLIIFSPKHSLPRRLFLGESTEQAPSSTDKIPTKTERSKLPRKPSIEKTDELLRTTIIEQVTFEDASLLEVAQKLNGLLRTKGISPDQLHITLSPDLTDENHYPLNALQISNASLSTILYEIADHCVIRHNIGPGTIELQPLNDPKSGNTVEKIQQKLDDITFPMIYFDDTTLLEARDFFRSRCRELDNQTIEPESKGIYFIIRPTIDDPDFRDKVIKTFKARNLTIRQALDQLTRRVGAKWQVNGIGVIITPDPNQQTVRTYQRLNEIVIHNIDFENTSVEEAIDFLRQRIREIEPADDLNIRSISIALRKPPIEGQAEELPNPALPALPRDPDRGYPDSSINLQAESTSLAEFLDLITYRTGMLWTIEDFAISITPLPEPITTPDEGVLPFEP